MLRAIYKGLLRLHPERFRGRYGEEMLWIFDQAAHTRARLGLLLDGTLSAMRQRTWRRDFDGAPALRPAAGAPSFSLVDAKGPGPQALLNGAMAACLAFAVAGLIIAHGRPSGTLVLPHVIMRSSNAPLPREQRPEAVARRRAEEAATRDIALAFAEMDADGDGSLSARETAPGAAERLRMVLVCADFDGDGAIRFAEFLKAVRDGEAGCAQRTGR